MLWTRLHQLAPGSEHDAITMIAKQNPFRESTEREKVENHELHGIEK